MSASPGYHIVTDPLKGDWEQLTALQFFRSISYGEDIPKWVTVTGLEELLLYLDGNEETETIVFLNRLLTQTTSGSPIAVQFLIDGTVTKDNRVYVEPSSSPGTRLYVDAMFRDPPTQEGVNHYWSERA